MWYYWCKNELIFPWWKTIFKMLGLSFSSQLNWGPQIVSLTRLSLRKSDPWFVLWNLFFLKLRYIFINLPSGLQENTTFMSRLVIAIWFLSVDIQKHHLLLPWNPWSILEMFPVIVISKGITLVNVDLNWLNWYHFFILAGDPLLFW